MSHIAALTHASSIMLMHLFRGTSIILVVIRKKKQPNQEVCCLLSAGCVCTVIIPYAGPDLEQVPPF